MAVDEIVTTDFLVTFFVGDRAATKKLSDVVKNKDNKLFRDSLRLPKGFILPFFAEKESANDKPQMRYFIRPILSSSFTPYIDEQLCDSRTIENGDYIIFKNEKGEIAFRLLFIATANIKLGYKKVSIQNGINIFIGRDPVSDIAFSFSDRMSREKHAAIRIDDDGVLYVEDLKHSVGVYVNGVLTHSKKLEIRDEVFIMGLSIINFGDFIAVRDMAVSCKLPPLERFNVKESVVQPEAKYFTRTPRILKSLDTDEIEIDAPPAPPAADKTPAILLMGPSITMAMVMLASVGVMATNAVRGGATTTVVTSGIMAVGMLLGAILWPTLLRSYQKRVRIAEEKNRHAKYTEYISGIEKILSAKSDRAVRLLNDNFSPPPEQLCRLLDDESSRLHLWERSFDDEDFLNVRLGVGQRAFDVKIKTPKQGFQLQEDELRTLPAQIANKYNILSGVPVTLDLMNSKVSGIIGSKSNVHSIIHKIILNLASLHSYDEVKIVIICPENESNYYEYAKNIPHVWSNDKKMRYFATNTDEVHFVFNAIDDIVKERENNRDNENKTISAPCFVFIITDEALIESEALLRYIENPNNTVGVISLFAYGDITKLPKSCRTIIQIDDTRSGYYSKNRNDNKFIEFNLDTLNRNSIASFMDKLASLPVKIDVRSLSMPDRASFLQMYKAGNVAELEIDRRWNSNNSAKSLAAPVGLMAGNIPFSLDIHEAYHGCHGLVAGTTGSGKSEFLQAFILSLAINYSPKEIAFVLVDFKGGDMARPFMAKPAVPALPHLAATISNLSGNILYRALVSFDAEIKSRQRLFNESAVILGVDKLDINSYHRYYKAGKLAVPLPHLVIIIDEFAQLKTQQPDFLTQLINVAQVGRSLGIHLILATQKPSGVVDPQIWSNSRFKVCLKVADKQDSMDMINRSDSAFIKNPGRCFIQVGYDEIYECVQSGYSGADYIPTRTYLPDDEITVQLTDNTATPIHSARLDLSFGKTDKTQLEAVVADIVALGVEKNLLVKPLWKDMLLEKIMLCDLDKGGKSLLQATVGLTDFVRTQEQKPLSIDFDKSGHIAVYGASGMGKTTFLQTLVYSLVCDYAYTPEELNIYAMDFSGRGLGYLNELPHTGDVVFEEEEGKISRLAELLQRIISERKRIFTSNNCGAFTDYCATANQRIPAILVLIDNYAPFHDKYMDLSDRFLEIISAGKAYGVYFVITGSVKNAIYYRIIEHISTYFTLKMNDEDSYFDIHNMRPPIKPEDIKGRGITVIDKEVVEFQIALAADKETETERMTEINSRYADIAKQWTGRLPIVIAETDYGMDSEYNDYSEYSQTEPSGYGVESEPPDSIKLDGSTLTTGVSLSGVSTYGLDFSIDFKLTVCANTDSDLLSYYINLMKNIITKPNSRVVILDDGAGYFGAIAEQYDCKYVKGCDDLSAFFEELKPELNDRLDNLKEKMDRLFLIIPNYHRFFEMMTEEQADFMRKITRHLNAPEYSICYVCGFNVNEDKNGDSLFFDLVGDSENYVICPGGYAKTNGKIANIPYLINTQTSDSYFIQRGKSVKIRW